MSEKYTNTATEYSDEVPSRADIGVIPPPYQPDVVQYAPQYYPAMQLQEFLLTDGFNHYNHHVFTNQSSLRKFKSWKHLRHGNPEFARAKEAQNLSIGMPLMVSKRSFAVGLGDTTFLRFYETRPSPEARDRLYDKVDNRQIGEVTRRRFPSYHRYKLQFKGTQFVIIRHERLPIIDFQIGPDRFRFIRQITYLSVNQFSYDLYLLDPNQPSLVDKLDSSLKVNKSNPLLGNAFANMFVSWTSMNRQKYASSHKVGMFDYFFSFDMFTRNKRCSSLSLFTVAGPQQEVNLAVEERNLIILAVALIIQGVEDSERNSKGNNRSNHGFGMNQPFGVNQGFV